jgi:hypothetical protein
MTGANPGGVPVVTMTGYSAKTTAAITGNNYAGLSWKRSSFGGGEYIQPAVSPELPSGFGRGNGWAAAFRGCTTDDPFDAYNTATATSAAGAIPSVSVTTTVANTLLLWMGSGDSTANTTPPTGFTEIADRNWCMGVAVKAADTAGTYTASGATHGSAGNTIAILAALTPKPNSNSFFVMFN